jgi:TM2 domain-containing membrane protein YozV
MNPQEPPPLPTEGAIAGYCRACGKALDQASIRHAFGTIYCAEHVPLDTGEAATEAAREAAASPYSGRYPYTSSSPAAANPDVSPPLAFILGFIPGVGAIYNGQYVKGLVHVVIIGLVIAILNSDIPGNMMPLLGLLLAAFWFYMPFEAYHTAKARRLGQPVDAASSLIKVPGSDSRFPVAPIVLIALGILLLLDNLGLLELRRAFRYWPVLLIAAGVYMLYARMSATRESTRMSASREAKR